MFCGLMEDFIHYCTWSWDEIKCLLQRFKVLGFSSGGNLRQWAKVIVHHNSIYIKSIVIFSFMKLAIKCSIVVMHFLVYCFFVYNIVVPWPFHKYFSTMQFPPILVVLKIIFFFTLIFFEYSLHQGFFNFLLSTSLHVRLHSKALFAKPMFKVK
jgi:hypothetical protein